MLLKWALTLWKDKSRRKKKSNPNKTPIEPNNRKITLKTSELEQIETNSLKKILAIRRVSNTQSFS